MTHSINKILWQINRQTQNIVFNKGLIQIKENNVINFFSLLQKIQDLSQTSPFNNFINNCYKLVLYKLLQNILFTKYEQTSCSCYQDKFSDEFKNLANISSSVIKESYCQILELIDIKKCQVMELILFLIFFLARQILINVCQNSQTLRHYFYKIVSQNNDQLSILSCVLINYEITGCQVKKHVYLGLKKKYLFKRDHLSKKGQSQNYSLQLMDLKINDQKNQVDKAQRSKKQQQNGKKIIDQGKKKIINKDHPQHNQSSPKNTWHDLKDTHLTTFFGSNKVQEFSYCTFRNSCAFTQKRNNHFKKQISCCPSLFSKVASNIRLKEQQNEKKRKMGMSLVNASLRFLFAKNEKKNIIRQAEKPSLAQWRKKINKMQLQTNIQRAKLDIQSKWKRVTRNSEQDNDCKASEFQKLFDQVKKNEQNLRQEEQIYQFRKLAKQQGIERQDKIGIVRNVVNFIETNKESKHKKIGSKQFKDQYRAFLKNMEWNYQNVVNQNNYNYRLQRVLLRNSRQ